MRKPLDRYIKGQGNVICDRTGAKTKLGRTRLEWTGWLVKIEEWEPRHPQDFVRSVPDKTALPIARPEGDDVFLAVGEVTKESLNRSNGQ